MAAPVNTAGISCPKCKGQHIIGHGTRGTKWHGVVRRLACADCGAVWSQGEAAVKKKGGKVRASAGVAQVAAGKVRGSAAAALAKKGWGRLTPEQRAERAKKGWETRKKKA